MTGMSTVSCWWSRFRNCPSWMDSGHRNADLGRTTRRRHSLQRAGHRSLLDQTGAHLQSDLLEALLNVLVFSCKGVARPAQLVTRHTLRELMGATPCAYFSRKTTLVNQRLASRLLEKEGHVVVVADDGAKALKACHQGNPHL